MIRSALIYLAAILILTWVFPDLGIVWRVVISLSIAIVVSVGLSIWREVSIALWLERMPDGSTATVGEHVFTRDHGYWSDGEQALDDDGLRHYALTEGDGTTTFSLPDSMRGLTDGESAAREGD